MKKLNFLLTLAFIFVTFLNYSQQKAEGKKITITGKVIEKNTNQPLEYATVEFFNGASSKYVNGTSTNNQGEFTISIPSGTYNIKIGFISFKSIEIKNKSLTENTNLGTTSLQDEAAQIEAVVVRSEKTTVDIKLDKKVYNVGKDILVKGGTVSDVLDNVPSVSVDVEGNVSLRGNENVRILIDGKPSNAININEALRMIPADAIDKVEVVTNPSARYDAEGGGGLLNIILKKGKTNGLNGTLMATTGHPDNHGLNGTLNYKSNEFNLFTTQGYSYRNNPGRAEINNKYLNPDNSPSNYVNENRNSDRINKNYNGSFGIEWLLDKSTSWTNAVNYRKSSGTNNEDVNIDNFNSNNIYTLSNYRNNVEDSKSENIEYTSNLFKKFKKEGHKLTVDASFSMNKDKNNALISNISTNSSNTNLDVTKNNQNQNRNLIQADYVLPIKKQTQFEAGFRGNFTDLLTDYQVENNGVINNYFTNILNYKEGVLAGYVQLGTKINKLSMLYGLRYESSDIDVNQITSNVYKNKKYDNFFPSAFFTYEIKQGTSISTSYSKRINRPRGREINPFNSYSSNINLFQGNPDINPSLTDAYDIGFLKKWNKLTLNTSIYHNKTKDAVQMIRKESGDFVVTPIDAPDVIVNGIATTINGGADVITPVMLTTPINIATEFRTGFELTLNYSPYKWWKLNSSFNMFKVQTKGTYSYTNYLGNLVTQDFGITTNSLSSKFSSRITLPYKIDWQTSATYDGKQKGAQVTRLGIFAVNLGFSKDVLKDKATIALNVNDLLNSRMRRMETYIPGRLEAYNEMQFRMRQITLSFTYRFNKSKSDKDKQPKRENEGEGGGEF